MGKCVLLKQNVLLCWNPSRHHNQTENLICKFKRSSKLLHLLRLSHTLSSVHRLHRMKIIAKHANARTERAKLRIYIIGPFVPFIMKQSSKLNGIRISNELNLEPVLGLEIGLETLLSISKSLWECYLPNASIRIRKVFGFSRMWENVQMFNSP